MEVSHPKGGNKIPELTMPGNPHLPDHGSMQNTGMLLDDRGKRERSMPDVLAMSSTTETSATPGRRTILEVELIRRETSRLHMQYEGMQEVAKEQHTRQNSMETTSNTLVQALTDDLKQVENQTLQHDNLLPIRNTCLDDIKERSQQLNRSHGVLKQAAEGLYEQRQRDTAERAATLNALHHTTTAHEEQIRNRQIHEQHLNQSDHALRSEMQELQKQLAAAQAKLKSEKT